EVTTIMASSPPAKNRDQAFMTEAAMPDTGATPAFDTGRLAAARRFSRNDRFFFRLTQICAIAVLAILAGVMVSLGFGAAPALSEFGPAFLWTDSWNPVTGKFGAVAPIYGTVVTSAIAMIIAVPVGLGIATFLTELCPQPLRRPIGIAIELLAGV